MKLQTNYLKKQIHQFDEAEDRIKCLKDSYKNETAYIIAGGPSLNKYSHEYYYE